MKISGSATNGRPLPSKRKTVISFEKGGFGTRHEVLGAVNGREAGHTLDYRHDNLQKLKSKIYKRYEMEAKR